MSQDDELGQYLEDGWEVNGFSVCMMAAGATSQHILLRKGNSLVTFVYVNSGPKEIGRRMDVLTPMVAVPPKKGFFG